MEWLTEDASRVWKIKTSVVQISQIE